MICSLRVNGFKCFDQEEFTFAPLTLLSGLNSSGKSSLLQAIRLLFNEGRELEGFGGLDELTSKLHSGFIISAETQGGILEFSHDRKTGRGTRPGKAPHFSYISASRFGPQRYLPMSSTLGTANNVGENGEFVLQYLNEYGDLPGVPSSLRKEEANSSSVHANVSAWLALISPGISFRWEPFRLSDIARAEFNGFRAHNVGFGLSYTLPIIVNVVVDATLTANKKIPTSILLVENPEAHLHPAGQTQLGMFLCRAAACGVQIILETHSDHLLNGIRIAVKEKVLPSIHTSFYFFSYSNEEEKSNVNNPTLDEFGYFDEWPDGFFDETERNLERLL
jgi:predicted ATPase